MRHMAFLAAIMATIATPAGAPVVTSPEPTGEISDYDRSALWNGCKSIGLKAYSVGIASNVGLTKAVIATAARRRLKTVRLYSAERWPTVPFISVGIALTDEGFHVSVAYHKDDWLMSSWETFLSGSYGRNGGFLGDLVSLAVDHFIVEYLRVNMDACRKSK